jgi:hypothetical protein
MVIGSVACSLNILQIIIILERYFSTDIVHLKFVGHNFKVSYRHITCRRNACTCTACTVEYLHSAFAISRQAEVSMPRNQILLWRVQVLETPFGVLLRFIYDFISHYNYYYNVTLTRMTASSLPCWFFILVGPLIAGFLDAALMLRLWSAPLISARFYSLPPWNRVLAPGIENTLSKGNFSSVVQVVVTGITFVYNRCSDNIYLPSRCLNPCGGGVEYLHRDPASRKRRRNGAKKGRAIA